MRFIRLVAAVIALATTISRAAESETPQPSPAWLKLAPTNGFALAQARVNEPISTDRPYKILVLPPELKDCWMLQRPILLLRHNVTNQLEVAQASRVFAAVLYSYVGKEDFTDHHFAELEEQGWKYVENEFKTTTFQSEHWDWQVLSKDVEAGPVTFRTHNAMTVIFVKPKDDKP
jgi:hypothetical protein